MATVIDILSVELGLNSAKFTAGVKEAGKAEEKLEKSVEKTGKTIEKTGKKTNTHARDLDEMARRGVKALNDVRNAAVQMFAAYATASGLKSLIENLTVSNANLGLMSKNLGISAVELKQWGNVAEQLGGSAAGTQQDIVSLARSLKDLKQTGNYSETLKSFGAMGVSLHGANGELKTSTQLMLDLADRVKGMNREDAYAFISNHSGMDEGTINMVLQGRDALQKQLDAQKANAEAAAANAEKSQKLREEIAQTKEKYEALANTLLTQLLPYLIQAADWLERNGSVILPLVIGIGALTAGAATLSTVMGLVSAAFTVVGGVVTIITTFFSGLVNIFMIFSAVIQFVGALLGVFVSPVVAVIAVIAALAAGIIYAYTHYKKFADIVDKALDWLGFTKNVDGVSWSFDKLKGNLLDLVNSIKDKVKPVFDWLAGVLEKIWAGDFKGAISMVVSGVVDTVKDVGQAVWDYAKNSDAGKAVGGAYGDAKAGYHEGQTGQKTEGANEGSMPYRGGKAVGKAKGVSKEKLKSIAAVAERIGVDPNHLAAVISFETSGTFNPAIKNKDSSATGLIQFMEKTAKGLGTTTADLRRMSFDEQMLYVEKYFKQRGFKKGKAQTLGDVYGAVTGYGYKRGTEAYERNKVWDSNKDGYVAKGEMVQNAAFRAHQRDYFGSMAASAHQVPRLPSGAALSRPAIEANSRPQSISTSEVKIDKIEVVTQASNAQGIASDIGGAVRRNGLIGRVRYGMT